jgi:hypothetical protein
MPISLVDNNPFCDYGRDGSNCQSAYGSVPIVRHEISILDKQNPFQHLLMIKVSSGNKHRWFPTFSGTTSSCADENSSCPCSNGNTVYYGEKAISGS